MQLAQYRPIGPSMRPATRDRWIELMSAALENVKLHPDATAMLRQFFEDSATFMINQD
jgi:truncated hemoglobin YjbI